ncbi:FAD-dependent oxidoreductase [Fulvivirgaceae bacterium PWU4]|uniref:Tryptophan 2-monooxygenase n=1 Tax=Chryseosolibacter histidini TaxID=2782349 RepID=A0AAP2DQF3_9BACT|nr:NAD(P)/FAD-dependent oxidoreductase [Chryseosolibacter histidini]MBT1700621.1 FAD-dependent oxidoreductase [Chryseosolibacter histidini]
MTLGEFLSRHFSGPEHSAFRDSITRFVEGYNAADLSKVSALAIREEWSQDDEPEQRRPAGGYGQLMEHLLAQVLQQGVTVHLSSIVSHIQWQPGKVVIETTDGNSYSAQKVLITVPIGVLQHERITFTPAIPAYLEAAKNIGFGSVIKFLLEFKTPFWENLVARPVHNMGFMLSDATIPTWWTQLPDTTPLLTGWLGGPSAAQLHTGAEQMLNEALRSLSYIFDCSVDLLRQQLRHWYISDWKNDPFACGAYSYATIETPRAREILNTPVADTIYFSGEAVYDGPHTGTVEAALVSGREAAIKMLHAYSEDVEN